MRTITDPAIDSKTITDLPIEMILMILRKTSLQAVLNFTATNRSFKEQLSNELCDLAEPLLIDEYLNEDNRSQIIQWSKGTQSYPQSDLNKLRMLYGVAKIYFSILNCSTESSDTYSKEERLTMLHKLSMSELNQDEATSDQSRPMPIAFRFHSIMDEGAHTLSRLIERSTHQSLKQIGLVNCKIGDLGAIALANMLTTNLFIEEIRLGFNRIKDDGAKAFEKCLQSNTTLLILGLAYNLITSSGVASLKQIDEKRNKGNPPNSLKLNLEGQRHHDEYMGQDERLNRLRLIGQVGTASQTPPLSDHQPQDYNWKCSIL